MRASAKCPTGNDHQEIQVKKKGNLLVVYISVIKNGKVGLHANSQCSTETPFVHQRGNKMTEMANG